MSGNWFKIMGIVVNVWELVWNDGNCCVKLKKYAMLLKFYKSKAWSVLLQTIPSYHACLYIYHYLLGGLLLNCLKSSNICVHSCPSWTYPSLSFFGNTGINDSWNWSLKPSLQVALICKQLFEKDGQFTLFLHL